MAGLEETTPAWITRYSRRGSGRKGLQALAQVKQRQHLLCPPVIARRGIVAGLGTPLLATGLLWHDATALLAGGVTVVAALGRCNGNVLRAAEVLGVSRPTLYDLMKRLAIK